MALQSNQPQPSHYILDEIHVAIQWLRSRWKALHIHLEWVPAHTGHPANEMADELAKATAGGTCSPCHLLSPVLHKWLPSSIYALKAKRKTTVLSRWMTAWQQSPRHAKMSKVNPSLPSYKSSGNLLWLPRRAMSILVQLCSGHVALNTFLKKIKAVPSCCALIATNQKLSNTFLLPL